MAIFKIDGKDVEIIPGVNVLQTAIKNDVYVPHYCYHPGLSAPANCRMCLVEVEVSGRRSLVPSCTAMPIENMIVETQSEGVKKNQNAIMEFLLINHPLDCPVCDQAGECELQNYSYEFGPDRSRFFEAKSIQPKKDIGNHIKLYSDRCIRCTRCIRFCDEISGTSELGYFNRGVHNEVDIFPGERLDNRLSGNTVDICPVGALLDKEFLFKQRVWVLDGKDTICNSCSTGCNIRADINKDRVYRIVPRENLEVNDYWMCDDGRYGWNYIHSDDRLLFPMLGRGDAEQLVLWEEAFQKIKEGFGDIMKSYGDGAVAGIASSHLTNEENYLFGRLFKEVFKGGMVGLRPKVSTEGDVTFKSGFTIHADKSPNSWGAREVLGGLGISVFESSEVWTGIKEKRIKGLYLLGGDPNEQLSREEREALSGLDFLVVQDILASELSSIADVVLAGAAFVEKEGTLTNFSGRLQQISIAIQPPGDALPDWEILKNVANVMGCEFEFSNPGEILGELAKMVERFRGVLNECVGAQGISLVGR